MGFKREKMLNYQRPKTRKKLTAIVNSYISDDYCFTDGIINDDEIPMQKGYEYKQAPPCELTNLN